MKVFKAFLRGQQSEPLAVFTAAILTGLACGFGAYAVKTAIHYISLLATDGMHTDGGNLRFLILPCIGIGLSVLFSVFVARVPLERGTGQVKTALAEGNYRLRGRLTFAPLIANAFTLGFGGSAGAEGPIAFAGAAMGSKFGEAFRLSPKMMRLLVGVGAGAGIAAIFKAPIGGVFFTLEVLALEMTTFSVFVLVTAALAAGLTSFALLGFTVDLSYSPEGFFSTHWVLPTILLGVFCGLYSLYYKVSGDAVKKRLISCKSRVVAAICSGAIAAGLLYLFPALYGEGYPSMVRILHGDPMAIVDDGPFYHLISGPGAIMVIALGIVLVKNIVTAATNNGGGVGGTFAPTLFAGCVLGLLFTGIANCIPGIELEAAEYAFMGMAGVMAGAIRAPFMAIFLTAEMSGNFSLFLPSVIVAFISYAISSLAAKYATRK